MIKLWTIQPVEWYERLLSDKIIFGEEKEIDFLGGDEDIKNAYQWMIKQMETRIGHKPFENAYPIWAWFQYDNINKRKPDLRSKGYLQKGTNGVRIEFEKEEKDVLLSDFLLWHHPLNFWHLADNEEEYNRFEELLKDENIEFVELYCNNTPKHIKEKIEKSWEKTLDMDYCPEFAAHPFEKKVIQATFWSLSLDEIKKVDYFTAR